jgi:hypothetical protein
MNKKIIIFMKALNIRSMRSTDDILNIVLILINAIESRSPSRPLEDCYQI